MHSLSGGFTHNAVCWRQELFNDHDVHGRVVRPHNDQQLVPRHPVLPHQVEVGVLRIVVQDAIAARRAESKPCPTVTVLLRSHRRQRDGANVANEPEAAGTD